MKQDFGIPNNEEAFHWYRKAAEQGAAEAQFKLGTMYEEGRDVTRDYKEAVLWYRKAAEQGLSRAQCNLGLMYDNGHGVAQDYKEAIFWYRKAAEQGVAQAQFNLGAMYREGLGVAKDNKEAVSWYHKAAEQGHARAQGNLGFMYDSGHGVARDREQAYYWYCKAAEQGDVDAQCNLSAILQHPFERDDLMLAILANEQIRDLFYRVVGPQHQALSIARQLLINSNVRDSTPVKIEYHPEGGKSLENYERISGYESILDVPYWIITFNSAAVVVFKNERAFLVTRRFSIYPNITT